jgi:hypothetical protein
MVSSLSPQRASSCARGSHGASSEPAAALPSIVPCNIPRILWGPLGSRYAPTSESSNLVDHLLRLTFLATAGSRDAIRTACPPVVPPAAPPLPPAASFRAGGPVRAAGACLLSRSRLPLGPPDSWPASARMPLAALLRGRGPALSASPQVPCLRPAWHSLRALYGPARPPQRVSCRPVPNSTRRLFPRPPRSPPPLDFAPGFAPGPPGSRPARCSGPGPAWQQARGVPAKSGRGTGGGPGFRWARRCRASIVLSVASDTIRLGPETVGRQHLDSESDWATRAGPASRDIRVAPDRPASDVRGSPACVDVTREAAEARARYRLESESSGAPAAGGEPVG